MVAAFSCHQDGDSMAPSGDFLSPSGRRPPGLKVRKLGAGTASSPCLMIWMVSSLRDEGR